MTNKVKLLFLCTGNSCRSQIAEGWTRALGGENVIAPSAGLDAPGKNPRAIAVMREAGIDISDQESTVVTEAMIESADVIVTVCGHADEHCPAIPAATDKRHWPLSDPARATGTEAEIMATFQATREEIRSRVTELLQSLGIAVS